MFSRPFSNPSGCTPAAWSVRVTAIDKHIADDPLLGPEMGCTSHRKREQEVEAAQKEGKRADADLRAPENLAWVSIGESQAKVPMYAYRRWSVAGLLYAPQLPPSVPHGAPAIF